MEIPKHRLLVRQMVALQIPKVGGPVTKDNTHTKSFIELGNVRAGAYMGPPPLYSSVFGAER